MRGFYYFGTCKNNILSYIQLYIQTFFEEETLQTPFLFKLEIHLINSLNPGTMYMIKLHYTEKHC